MGHPRPKSQSRASDCFGSRAVRWLDRREPANVTAARSRSPSCRFRGCRSRSDEPSWNGRLVVTYEFSVGSARRRFGVAGTGCARSGPSKVVAGHRGGADRSLGLGQSFHHFTGVQNKIEKEDRIPLPWPARRCGPISRHRRDPHLPRPRATIGAAAPATLATNLRRILLAKNGRVAARLRREHPTRKMTICRSIPADVCLRRALRAQAASNRQPSPVRASWERPANGRKCLIARMFAALRSDRLRFLACFSGANRGETGALVPLFAASVGVISSTRQTKLACVERGVSLPFRCQGKNFLCRRSLVTAPLGHQPSGRYGRIANEPGSPCCRFANLPCRRGKLEKAGGIAAVRGGDSAGHPAILAPRLQRWS
jgi:hypothetical protein